MPLLFLLACHECINPCWTGLILTPFDRFYWTFPSMFPGGGALANAVIIDWTFRHHPIQKIGQNLACRGIWIDRADGSVVPVRNPTPKHTGKDVRIKLHFPAYSRTVGEGNNRAYAAAAVHRLVVNLRIGMRFVVLAEPVGINGMWEYRACSVQSGQCENCRAQEDARQQQHDSANDENNSSFD